VSEGAPSPTPSALGVWLSAARPRTLPAAVAPVLVGTAMAAHDHALVPGAAVLCLSFALLVQVGTNFANDYFDFVKGADTEARVGPRRAVAAGIVKPATMRRAMFAVFAVAFVLGLSLIHWGGPWMLAIGIASILSGIAYTGGPWPLGYHGLGDVFVFIFFGLVAVSTTYFVQAGTVTGMVVLASVPMGLLAANILLVNNYRDADTDAAANKRTVVVRFGRRYARVQFGASIAVALLVPMTFRARGYSSWCLLPLAVSPIAFSHIRRLKSARGPLELVVLLGDTGKLLALYAVLFTAGVTL
jgi:1,4-dihydroxy-2-naphthoate octaprenyltransferase